VLVEVTRKAYLASIVPVIVNAVLNDHQVVVDIVAFVPHDEFPRSRLGEKQRGKILAGWISRKMQTMAQFAIRDMDGPFNGGDTTMLHRQSTAGSIRSVSHGGGPVASSLRNVEQAPQILEQDEADLQQQMDALSALPGRSASTIVEMPAELPPQQVQTQTQQFPTRRSSIAPSVADRQSVAWQHGAPPGYLPQQGYPQHDQYPPQINTGGPRRLTIVNADSVPSPSSTLGPSNPYPAPGVVSPLSTMTAGSGGSGSERRQSRLPAIDGREALTWDDDSAGGHAGQQGAGPEDDDWTRDAIMHMNLAGR
jgi:hypothetical protein